MTRSDFIATYRVQFRGDGFTLDDAAAQAGYLAALGVSHLYASPYLQAGPNSTHGYDVTDYRGVSADLGGDPARQRMVDALRKVGMGHILDTVPNHMAMLAENPWWRSVLENGPASRYAGYFDFEWDPPETRHAGAILLPVLGDHYGVALEAGEIQLVFADEGFTVQFYENSYPVDPCTLEPVFARAAKDPALARESSAATLSFLAAAYRRIPSGESAPERAARARDVAVLDELLAGLVQQDPTARAAVEGAVAAINADPDALDQLLRKQNYRLAWWKISARELGYRRFFDINTMIGMRQEDEAVFRDSHALILSWLRGGSLDGLRIDHPDGLRDPKGYLQMLREAVPGEPFYLVVEKILESEEELPADWDVDGTSGYDFLNRLNGLFVDSRSEEVFGDLYANFTGQDQPYSGMVLEMKRNAGAVLLGSDLNRLVELFLQVCEATRTHRDYTRDELRSVLLETAACLPVYRTYFRPGDDADAGAPYLDHAIQLAQANRPDLDPRLFAFLREILSMQPPSPKRRVSAPRRVCAAPSALEGEGGTAALELAARFQQFTGPVMAKGVEDTSFYRYNRFVSLNEVGGSPGRFGVSVADFHRACAETLARHPRAMLSTATHDTKRGEDTRARLNVLTEVPGPWSEAVQRWAERNAQYKRGGFPDANAEYLLYQNLVGAHPVSAQRMTRYMEKAAREAKAYTTWTDPVEEYETALKEFVEAILADEKFVTDLDGFVRSIREDGWVNSLAQTVLKLTTPGVPDIYQGTELWSHTLVDPDNRDPVDYELRARLLAEIEGGLSAEAALARMEEGLPKLFVIHKTLALRRSRPDDFGPQGVYTPVPVPEDTVVAFRRGGGVFVLAPRLARSYCPRWVELPVTLPPGLWRNIFTGESLQGGEWMLADLLGTFPVAVMEFVE